MINEEIYEKLKKKCNIAIFFNKKKLAGPGEIKIFGQMIDESVTVLS